MKNRTQANNINSNKTHNLNTFKGNNAIKDFLNPEKSSMIPLVELPDFLNPFAKDGIRIFAKLMNTLPMANVKSLPALNMLMEAQETGKLKNVNTLIESSSGNTVFSLATIARWFGIKKTKAIVSHEVTWGKLQLLRLLGTEIVVNREPICPNPKDKEGGIYKAKIMGKGKGCMNLGQYDNEANPRAHFKWTAPQIWKQTEGKITVLCAGVGTTGTIVGIADYLKKKSKKIVTVGVSRFVNNPIPGPRTSNLLVEIDFNWEKATDFLEEVGTKESFEESLKLCRSGLLVGPSSGFALAGLLNFLSKQKNKGKLDNLKNEDGEVIAVFICPDGPLPYLNEYFEYLNESNFPSIENKQFLINKPEQKKQRKKKSFSDIEINVRNSFKKLYKHTEEELWGIIKDNKKVSILKNTKLIDLRVSEEFKHVHLIGSDNMEYNKILQNIDMLSKKWKEKKIILICRSGKSSFIVAEALRNNKVNALSINGGVIEWSRLNLPRFRPKICKEN